MTTQLASRVGVAIALLVPVTMSATPDCQTPAVSEKASLSITVDPAANTTKLQYAYDGSGLNAESKTLTANFSENGLTVTMTTGTVKSTLNNREINFYNYRPTFDTLELKFASNGNLVSWKTR